MIIEETPSEIQTVWLRVSSDCFELAGRIIYADIVIIGDRFNKLTEGLSDGAIQGGGEGGKAAPDFMMTLLSYVQTITIKGHRCRYSSASINAQAVRSMVNLKQTILCPDWHIVSISQLCFYRICPLFAGLAYHSVTIHNIQASGPVADFPLHQFMPILDNAKHVTLFLPMTTSYIGRDGWGNHGLPQDLAYPTRKLDSVGLLIGTSASEFETLCNTSRRSVEICSTSHLQDFLASFIALNST